ncbi:MAG TPA: ATP-binding protein, partial [Candidatus Saccharimonadales bacterium]|jgi:signal transduction histidine kinase|nr:ATP-binding protein [Candidatus Saccharimonadales bacterium]
MITAKDFSSVGARTAAARPKPGAESLPAVPAGAGEPAAVLDDKAEIARLRECLARSEEFSQALLSTVSDLVLEVRKDGLILSLHAPKDHEFGLTPEHVVGRRVMELLTTHIGQLGMHYLEKAFRTGVTQTFSCQYLLPGKLRYFETRIAVRGGGIALAVVRDVTDRETLEKEVVESSSRVQTRIGQDIHDGLGQHLTGITFLSRALERNLAAKNLPEAAEAAEIGKLVIEALSQTRNLARGLFPVEVESTRLCQSLRELANTAEQLFHISCTVECDPNLMINSKNASTHLFRLAQEAINNAVKHGRANHVSILLGTAGEKAVLRIIDDGVGFPPENARRNGLGLRIMTYRAQKVGGTLEIQPGQHGGTVVSCTFNPNIDEN